MSEILLFGVIGEDVTAPEVKALLAEADRDEELVVRIDSPGGSVFVGNAIHSALSEYDGPKKAVVESFAGSIASYILTAFDNVEITPNGYVMIHNPTLLSEGDDEDHARDAKLLGEIKDQMVNAYARRLRMSADETKSLMKAETFFSATEALERGFATSLSGQTASTRLPEAFISSMPYGVVASLRPANGENPKPKEKPVAEKNEPVAASVKEIKAAFPRMGSDFVLKCVEKEMPMASVAAAAAEELMAENETMKAENEELKMKLAAMEEESAKAKAMEEEETSEEAEAKAKAKANGPVAVGGAGESKTATAMWREAVEKCQAGGIPKAKAVQMANRKNPGLRERMLAEANVR